MICGLVGISVVLFREQKYELCLKCNVYGRILQVFCVICGSIAFFL